MALTLMVTMLATMQTMAQDTKSPTCQVTGTIRDKATHEPELAATIIVAKQSQPKVAFKKGVTDTGGVFSLTLPATDARYILTASVLGKKAAQVKLTMTPADTLIDLGDILLADDARLLDEVQVLAQKPLVTMDVDKLTYDVASDPDAKYMMTSEILNKVPLLDVDGMGNIKMNGTTNFLILQNGRRTAVTRHPKEILRRAAVWPPVGKYAGQPAPMGGILPLLPDKLRGQSALPGNLFNQRLVITRDTQTFRSAFPYGSAAASKLPADGNNPVFHADASLFRPFSLLSSRYVARISTAEMRNVSTSETGMEYSTPSS